MEISKKLLGGLLGILLAGCLLTEEEDASVTVDYPGGEFYVSMVNNTWIYFTHGTESRTWNRNDLESRLGELRHLTVEGIKVLGEKIPDYGDLTVTIEHCGQIVVEETAPIGTPRAFAEYWFY